MLQMIAVCGLALSASAWLPPQQGSTGTTNSASIALQGLFTERAAPVAAWVFFTDKGFSDGAQQSAAIAGLASTYPTRAVERRRLRRTSPGLFDERDLPVAAPYIDAVLATGATRRTQSRWLNAISVELTPDQAQAIAALPFVRSIEPVAPRRRDEARTRPAGPAPEGGFYGRSEDQLTQIDLIDVHTAGFTGQSVVIGILDTGFRRSHIAFNNPSNPLSVIAEYDFVDDDPNTAPEPGDPPSQHSHGTLILGTLGAYMPDELVGGAYSAQFILCKTEDTTQEVPQEEDFYVAGLEFIEFHGGDMATSSLGYIDWYSQSQLNGLTAVTTIGVNTATDNGVHCCTAAGNEGHDSNPNTSALLAPADAFEVISCGAVSGESSILGFSSDGPTADGRVKPELLARGDRTSTVSSSSDTGYTTASGTSLATPLVAAAVACLTSAHPEWSVDRMRSLLFTTATDFVANGVPDPLFVRGYGIVQAGDALAQDCYADCDSSTGLGTLDIFDFLCFQNRFATGNSYACECDVSTGVGVCDIFDFLCFQNAFAAGCP
jgi:subtilisin family serine protease